MRMRQPLDTGRSRTLDPGDSGNWLKMSILYKVSIARSMKHRTIFFALCNPLMLNELYSTLDDI